MSEHKTREYTLCSGMSSVCVCVSQSKERVLFTGWFSFLIVVLLFIVGDVSFKSQHLRTNEPCEKENDGKKRAYIL